MATKHFYHHTKRGTTDYSRTTAVATGSIAERNRHTGKPHEHKREINRFRRQRMNMLLEPVY